MILGCHLSVSKGFSKAAEEAIRLGGNTFQFFTRNPRGGNAKALNDKDLEKLKMIMEEHHFGQLLAHAPYTLNMASGKDSVYEFAKIAFSDDMERMAKIPTDLYNFHPGSHIGIGVEAGTEKIVNLLNDVLTGEERTFILLETMSGKGTEIGKTFEELQAIIEQVKHQHLMGVCLDTCHVYSAGYDIVNDLDGVLDEFDRVIGLDRLKAIHLNDSMKPLKSYKDRHEKIGEGTIGLETVINVINHQKLKHLPFFLETPNESAGYAREIELLKKMRND